MILATYHSLALGLFSWSERAEFWPHSVPCLWLLKRSLCKLKSALKMYSFFLHCLRMSIYPSFCLRERVLKIICIIQSQKKVWIFEGHNWGYFIIYKANTSAAKMQTTNLKKKKQDHHNLMAIYKERPLNHVRAQKKKRRYMYLAKY